jgi:hypothetical protein
MNERVKFSSLLASGPKGDPCHFRLEVTGADGTRLVHDFLINATADRTRDKAKEFGRELQKLLQALEWGDDPKAVFDRDVIYALASMLKALSRDSAMVIRDRAPGLGATYTSIKVASERDCKRLMKALKKVSKQLLQRKRK